MKITQKILYVSLAVTTTLLAESPVPPNQEYHDYSTMVSGKTGLIENPTARVMDDWTIRPFYYYGSPFLYYGLAFSPLPRLELEGRFTEIKGIPGFLNNNGYGNYKDKAFDFKYLLVKEDDVVPAIAVGVDDMQGTGLYSSRYIVATKRAYQIDWTVGIAQGRLGGEDLHKYFPGAPDAGLKFWTQASLGNPKPFVGFEAFLTKDISVKCEYSQINYLYDKVSPFMGGTNGYIPATYKDPTSKINTAVKYSLGDHVDMQFVYERGNSYGVQFSFPIGFGDEGLYKHPVDTKWRAKPEEKENYFGKMDDKNLSYAIGKEVAAEKFGNVDVAINQNKIWVGFENGKYNSDTKAIGRVMDTIDEVAPERIDTIYTALKQSGKDLIVARMDRSDVRAIKDGYVSSDEIQKYLDVSTHLNQKEDEFSDGKDVFKTERLYGERFNWLFKPSLEQYINDQDNPYVYKISALFGARAETFAGGFISGRIMVPFVNTTDKISVKQLDNNNLVTRSDALKYLQYNKPQLYDLSLGQIFTIANGLYAKAEVGYFEPEYGGFATEIYKTIDDGKYGVGLEYQAMKKREVNSYFGFENYSYYGRFINLYAGLVPELGIETYIKYGTFLAGDKGVKVSIQRKYKSFIVGAYMTKTDTSVFAPTSSNRGYTDKGIYLSVPIGVVSPENVKGSLWYGLAPWTRDVGQSADTSISLPGMDSTSVYDIKRNAGQFKE